MDASPLWLVMHITSVAHSDAVGGGIHPINSGVFVDRTADPVDMPQAERWAIGEQLREAGGHGAARRCPTATLLPSSTVIALARHGRPSTAVSGGMDLGFAWYYLYSDSSDGLPISVDAIFGHQPCPAARSFRRLSAHAARDPAQA